jgi:ABC-type multidrug transport system ATPase subunit
VALFAFDAVTVAGAARPRLDAVSVELPDGGVTGIAGPSGAG